MEYLLKLTHPDYSVEKLNEIGESFNHILPGSFDHGISPRRRVVSINVGSDENACDAFNKIKQIKPQIISLSEKGCSFSLWFFVDAPDGENGPVEEDYLFDCEEMTLLTSLKIDLILSVSCPLQRTENEK